MYAKMEEWSESVWQIIEQFPDTQYLSFWVAQGILDNNRRHEFDIIPENKQYILLENKRDFESYNTFIDHSYTIQKIEPRLNELENKGYTFTRRNQK